MRHCVWLVMMALLLTACVSPVEAGENAAAAASKENVDLKRQLRELHAQMQQMQKRLEALEGQVSAGAATHAGASPAPAVAISGAPAPPPGVVPAGVPLPAPSPPAQTMGRALKDLLPGPVSGPTVRRIGTAAPEEAARGVIVPSVQGVPKVFIPDIGAVGDFTLRQSDLRHGDPRYSPADDQFRVRDGQIILFSPIDPYTNAQISIDKPDREAFDIEEAFLVFNKLPWDLTVRAGQFRPRFGLINETDTFQLPMVERPQALAQYIGGDGFVTPGVNVSGYVPNPWDADLKADVNMLTGHNTEAFNRNEGQTFDFLYMGSLAYSRDLFRTGALSTGVSAAGGPGPGGQTYLQDPFVQVQYAPSQRQIWTWYLEALLAERQGVGDHGLKRGFYSLVDYNFWLRYHAGLLVDMADRPGVPSGTEVGVSPILTYFVSDNTRLRLEYTHRTGSGPERAADFFYTQATFSLGNLKPLE
jgi:hypothetical protein